MYPARLSENKRGYLPARHSVFPDRCFLLSPENAKSLEEKEQLTTRGADWLGPELGSELWPSAATWSEWVSLTIFTESETLRSRIRVQLTKVRRLRRPHLITIKSKFFYPSHTPQEIDTYQSIRWGRQTRTATVKVNFP